MTNTKILFVCTGNTCRSPMAETLLRHKANQRGLSIQASSAGVYAYDGQMMSAHAQEVMRQWQVAGAEAFRSARLTEQAVREANLVLTMTAAHKRATMALFPFAADKIYTLNEFAYEKMDDVADPFGGSYETYRMTATELDEALDQVLTRLYLEA
jgi:protein-tyrosine phosphatase